jgi:hypothetical protein
MAVPESCNHFVFGKAEDVIVHYQFQNIKEELTGKVAWYMVFVMF